MMLVALPRAGWLRLLAAGVLIAQYRAAWLTRYLAGFGLFVAARALADDLGRPLQVAYPILLDRWLLGTLPTLALQAHRTPLEDALATSVYLSYFLLPPTALVIAAREWPHRIPRYVTATLWVFGIAVVVHAMWPTAPPWVASQLGVLPPITQVIYAVFGEGNAFYAAGQGVSGNPVAAFPSVHLGIATVVACLLWPTSYRVLGLYVPLMLWAVVYSGEHYAVDGLAGIGLGLICWRWSVRAR